MPIRALAAIAVAVCLSHSALIGRAAEKDRPERSLDSKSAEGPAIEFPATTGSYKVGRASYHLVDSSRKEIFTEAPDDNRELMVTVHYPADVAADQSPSPYADAKLAAVISEVYHRPISFLNRIRSHAVAGASLARKEGGYPIVIFSPGFNVHPLFYTSMVEELASQGFVVASVCHPYSTGATVFPDGRVVRANAEGTRFELDKKDPQVSPRTMIEHRDAIGEIWLGDVRFVLDSLERLNEEDKLLAGQLDLAQVGIVGHSFGGSTAAAAVQRDPRFRAGINLDGTDFSSTRADKIANSVLWLLSVPPDISKMPPPKIRQAKGDENPDAAGPKERALPLGGPLPKGGSRIVLKGDRDQPMPALDPSKRPQMTNISQIPLKSRLTIAGSKHQTFQTDMLLMAAAQPPAAAGDVVTIDGRRAVLVINSLVSGFFRKHLRGENVPILDNPAAEFPEAIRGSDQN